MPDNEATSKIVLMGIDITNAQSSSTHHSAAAPRTAPSVSCCDCDTSTGEQPDRSLLRTLVSAYVRACYEAFV